MCRRKVGDVNIVADRGAVRCRKIGAVHDHARQRAKRGQNHVRNEMRLGVVRLADLALRVGAGRVEVPQDYRR